MRRLLSLLLGMLPLGVLLLDGGGAPLFAAPDGRFRGVLILPREQVPDFTLIDQHGRSFRLRDQRNRVVVLAFGYTYCVDLCPLTLGTLKRARRALASDAARVRLVFVTVDPQRDTPARLQAYLATFHPDFLGLRGPAPEVARVYRSFGVVPERFILDAHRVATNHPTAIYVIDQTGVLRLSYNAGGPAEDIVHDLRRLLGE